MAILNQLNDFNLKLLYRSRRNLVVAMAFGLVALVLLILTYTQVSAALQTNGKLSAKQRQVDQLNRKAQELEQLKFSPEFTQAAKINEVLPSHKPLLELLNNLNNVAGETRVAITEFEISPGEIATDSTEVSQRAGNKQQADYNELRLELTIVGGLNQVREFMDLIERVSPLTTITSLTIDRKVGANVTEISNATRADLALNTYYYTKPISSTLSAPLPEISNEERRIFQEILQFSPSEIEEQTEIISGSNSDLFGIQGLTVSDLEEVLEVEESSESAQPTE
jgi:hypothetical protein